jgi:drug/metabolite transporter (DMT)-like permease
VFVMVETIRKKVGSGFVLVIASCLFFATSGTFAKALITAGWSPLAVVTVRVGGAALILLPWSLGTLRGRWAEIRGHLGLVGGYGLLGIAAAQLGYFGAVQRLDVAVALLIEYLGIVLVVLWIWLRTRVTPHAYTLLGVALSIAGLALVLQIFGAAAPDVVGVLWGLFAAIGMAGHYVLAARPTPVPAVAFAGLGLTAGFVLLVLAGVLGVVPFVVGGDSVVLGGSQLPAWVALAELIVIAAAAAYLMGIAGARRLGSTLASFVGLTEVLFAVLIAWVLLGETPGLIRAIGGLLILGGVVAVRMGEMRAVDEHPEIAADDVLVDPEPEAVHAP